MDPSALVAILRAEPGADLFREALMSAPTVAVSAASVVEISIVMRPWRRQDVERLLHEAAVDIVDFDAEQARFASDGHARFGRGSGSPARLNLGDCYSYGLARATGRPLLFKGDDFHHTDVTPAIPRG